MNSGKKKAATLTKLLELSEQLINKSKWYKSVGTKHEEFSAKLKTISNEILVIKNTLQLKDKDLSALDTAAKALHKRLKTITKEIQKTQKQFSKKQTEIRTKLLGPIETVEGGSKTLLDVAKENCRSIEVIIKTSRGYLEEDCKTLDECSRNLKDLSLKLAKLLLSKTVEDCTITSLDLKERLEAVVKSTVDMTADDTPQQFDPVSVKNTLTLLRDHCSSNVRLLDLVHTNVKRVFPDTDGKVEKKDDKQEVRRDGTNGTASSNTDNRTTVGIQSGTGAQQLPGNQTGLGIQGGSASGIQSGTVVVQQPSGNQPTVGIQSSTGVQQPSGIQSVVATPSLARSLSVTATQAVVQIIQGRVPATNQGISPAVQDGPQAQSPTSRLAP